MVEEDYAFFVLRCCTTKRTKKEILLAGRSEGG